MPASFGLGLDTTAPRVTWGAVVDPVASEEMSVQYLLDEPGVERAEIELRDGRVLSMVVEATRLVVLLPADAPEGAATVRLYVVDDVLNAATRELVVAISGVLPETPAPTPSGMPRVPNVQIVSGGSSVARVVDSYSVAVTVAGGSAARVRSRYVAPTRRAIRWRSIAGLDSTTGTTGNVRSAPSGALVGSSDVVTRRPEGPRAEEEIALLLGLF